MIDLSVLKGSSYVVLGLARSGLTTVRALVAAGVEYAAWDDNEVSRTAAAQAGVRLIAPDAVDWSKVTALVISPGIPNLLPAPHPMAAPPVSRIKKVGKALMPRPEEIAVNPRARSAVLRIAEKV